MRRLITALLSLLLTSAAVAQDRTSVSVCAECIRKNMEFLASDAMRGRGSGTQEELKAAKYIGEQLKAYGIEPAGDLHGYVQKVSLTQRKISSPPTLKFLPPKASLPTTFTFGKDFLGLDLMGSRFAGRLQKVDSDAAGETPKAKTGAVILITGKDRKKIRTALATFIGSAAKAMLIPSRHQNITEEFQHRENRFPELPSMFAGQLKSELGSRFNGLELSAEMVEELAKLPEGTLIRFRAPVVRNPVATWNAVGILTGSDPTLQHAAVLFSAHLDHVGIGKPVNGDSIYNGADDNSSGCSAVMEIARVLGSGTKPKRTVIFALFGSEEAGGTGANYFREHPPIPLSDFAANLEFEMIGRPDSVVNPDTLWLTGWERSNLGPTLASHGAHLVGDPHPDENFFSRSDNYVLAKKGVVAQTISSYGLHKDYHQPSDDIAHIDFKHMDDAIGSLLEPIEWLVNSDFKPRWNEGGRP
jgi:aminopeptidase YwaD